MAKTYDLETPQGMANAKEWMHRLLHMLQPQAQWAVPRTGTIVTFDKPARTAHIQSASPDPAIARVLREVGFTVTGDTQ